jgi:4-aminobutyrate aminotransferase-like enzyme
MDEIKLNEKVAAVGKTIMNRLKQIKRMFCYKHFNDAGAMLRSNFKKRRNQLT